MWKMDLRKNARPTIEWNEEMLKQQQQQQTDKRKIKTKKIIRMIILPYYRLRKMIVFDSSSKSKVNASRSWASDFGYWWSLLSRDERVISTRRASLARNSTSGTAENCYPRVGVIPVILAQIMHFGPSITFIERSGYPLSAIMMLFHYYKTISFFPANRS